MINNSEQGLSGIAQVPDNFCYMCKQQKEVIMEQVCYPDHGGQKTVCFDCRTKLREAITKTLDLLGWD